MKKIDFTVNSWVFGPIPFEELVKRACRIGLSGLELDGEPEKYDVSQMRRLLMENNLKPVSVCGTFSRPDRAFNHSDEKMREKAVIYGKSLVDMAKEAGADRILLVPSEVFHLEHYADAATDWQHSVEAVRQVACYAKEKNIKVMLECVNKYEVNMVYSLQDGIRMAKDIDTGNVGLVADTFHMQLEEKDGVAGAIRNTGKEWIMHQHLGDNNRELPGKGSMNWQEILKALRDIEFEGALSFEPLPGHLTPEEIGQGRYCADVLEKEMKKSMDMMKGIMALL